jgi:hypothetical protein
VTSPERYPPLNFASPFLLILFKFMSKTPRFVLLMQAVLGFALVPLRLRPRLPRSQPPRLP